MSAAVAPGLGERARAWEDRHPGWSIEEGPALAELRDPEGDRQARDRSTALLLDGLERAELRVGTEREQLALLRENHPRDEVVVCDGEWEATRLGVHRLAAGEAWLLEYRLRKEGR